MQYGGHLFEFSELIGEDNSIFYLSNFLIMMKSTFIGKIFTSEPSESQKSVLQKISDYENEIILMQKFLSNKGIEIPNKVLK